jgi:autotransporter-associated beta strand protein
LQTAAFEIKGASGAVLDNNNTDLKVHTQRTNGNLAISIPIQGDGGLTYWGNSNEFWLSAANTFTGSTRLLTANTYLNNKLGLQNSTLNYALGDAGILDFRQVGSSGSPNVLGGLSGSRSLNLLRSDRSGAMLASNVISIGNNGQSTTYSGALSGTTASIIKTGTGTLTLTGANSYGGSTTISSGTLALSGSGSIANSTAIAVGTDATFDVSGVTEGWSLGASQTLRGTGTLLGNATVNGIVAPGAPSGTLSVSGNLAFAADSSLASEIDLAGTAQVETATAAGTPTADGSINATVTGADIAGSPVLINVTVLTTDTTDDWAGKVRTALAGDAAITAIYQVGGGGAAITLTRIIPAANDSTLNIALASGSADPGITAATTSADTTVGGLPTGSDVLAVSGALDISAATLNLTASGLTAPAYVIATYGTLTQPFVTVTGLPAGYVVDYAYSGNQIAIKQSSGSDTTPPLWSDGWPLVDTATSSGFSAHAKTNENGSAYYVVLANDASAPSAAQVKAGQDSAGAAAPSKGTLTLTANTEAVSPVTGLAPDTSYDVWFVAEDAVPNLQASPVKIDVTTLATLSPYAEWIGGFSVGGLSGPGDDPDADGKPNFLEFALNSDPATTTSQGKVFVKLATVGGTPNVLTLTVAVRSAAAAFAAEANNQKAVDATDSLSYLIEAANSLADWGNPLVTEVIDAGDLTTIQAGLPSPDPGWSYHSFRSDGDTATDPSDFIRVKVTSP